MPNNDELATPEEVKTSSVHLRGDLSRPPSRALWLVKWLIAFPHYIVLIFLFILIPFVLLIAFFAIIFTGRYPRGLFNYTVGVYRWGWRVSFYAFMGGTDKYPPFSLKTREDYPADFHVDYSERLSQWKPLVKWFLALPHYFVLFAFFGVSGSYNEEKVIEPFRNRFSIIEVQAAIPKMQDAPVESSLNLLNFSERADYFDKEDKEFFAAFPGLFRVLVLIALIALLFTGRYHRDIFKLLMGIQRWGYRVFAYVYLLTDEYPHFKLME